jgi:hypothetical protein
VGLSTFERKSGAEAITAEDTPAIETARIPTQGNATWFLRELRFVVRKRYRSTAYQAATAIEPIFLSVAAGDAHYRQDHDGGGGDA